MTAIEFRTSLTSWLHARSHGFRIDIWVWSEMRVGIMVKVVMVVVVVVVVVVVMVIVDGRYRRRRRRRRRQVPRESNAATVSQMVFPPPSNPLVRVDITIRSDAQLSSRSGDAHDNRGVANGGSMVRRKKKRRRRRGR